MGGHIDRVPIITLSNQKGGVGKTTTADAIIDGMRRRGLSVLAIDADSQGSLGTLQERYCAKGSPTFSSFMAGAPVVVDGGGQAVVPGDPDTYGIESMLDSTGEQFTEYSLLTQIRQAIEIHSFDAVVVDTHPGLSFATISALVAATHIIVPSIPDRLAVDGVRQTAEYINTIAESFEMNLRMEPGVLITMYRSLTKISSSVAAAMRQELPEWGFSVFKRQIPLAVAIQNAQLAKESIFESKVLSGAAYEYDLLCEEVMQWAGLSQ